MPNDVLERTHQRLRRPADPPRRPPGIFELSFSAVGLVVGLYFLAISLTPSLLPRTGFVQGLGSGLAFAIGYGLGAGFFAVLVFLGVPRAHGRLRAILLGAALILISIQAALAIWNYVGWQNQTRLAFGMEPLSPQVWIVIVLVAATVAAVLFIVARSLRKLFRWGADLANRWLPRRLAQTIAATVLVALLWWVLSGAFVSGFFSLANWMFSSQDLGNKPGSEQPLSPLRSGSPSSLVEWDELGRQGREFVSHGPTVEQLNDYSGGGALEPIRAYVGLRSADTIQGQADLLLEELRRTGAFEREILVLTSTTGTGFINSRGIVPLEYLWNGDTAIAGVQYSYLPSWISLLADQQRVAQTSKIVFSTVHEYWMSLPEGERPRLYLYGLSLGSYGVESVLTSPDMLNEPIDGALMSGPTLVNPMHQELIATRDEGSTPWQPVINDGRTVRFTSQENGLAYGDARWGPTRVVYLQHGSDPVTWFHPSLAFQPPAWLEPGQRPPDVDQTMSWYPLVTMWQVLLDMPGAGSVPEGFGHLYTFRENLDAWVGITQPDNWTEADSAELAELIQAVSDERDAQVNPVTG